MKIEITIFTTTLNENTKPFFGHHFLHGIEIISTIVFFNTFFHATGASFFNNINFHISVAISAFRHVQVVVQGTAIRLMSRLAQKSDDVEIDSRVSWLIHIFVIISVDFNPYLPPHGLDIDLACIKSRIDIELKPSFSIDYFADVGVSAMNFF